MLEWNVYCEYNQKIEVYNIFNHPHFVKDLVEMFKEIKKEETKYNKEHNLIGLISVKDSKKRKKYMSKFEDELLKRKCSYNFWAKAEYEIVLTDWPPSINKEEIYRLVNENKRHAKEWGEPAYRYSPNLCICEKIDIYNQLRLNWGVFKDYVFDNEKEIKKLYNKKFKKDDIY